MRRAPVSRLLCALVVLGATALGCTSVVAGNGSPAQPPPPKNSSGSSAPSGSTDPTGSTGAPSSPAPSSSSSAAPIPARCPVVDRRAGLQFECLRTGMQSLPTQDYPTQIVYPTETNPAWYMSELTQLRKTQAGLKVAVGTTLIDFVTGSYPQNSKGASVSEKATTIAGRAAYVVDGRVTIARTGEFAGLQAKQDRVLLVAITRPDNVASVLIIAVPDTAKSLWPTMDRIAAGVKLV